MSIRSSLYILPITSLLAACSANPFTGESQISNAALGAGAGAALGAGAGLATGSMTQADPKQSALIGAGVGAAAGTAAGLMFDAHNAKIHDELQAAGVSVTRLDRQVQMNMNKALRFLPGTATFAADAPQILNAVKRVLAEYPRSHATIAAYVSAGESPALASKRAKAVATYLSEHGIDAKRLSLSPYGGDASVQITLDAA